MLLGLSGIAPIFFLLRSAVLRGLRVLEKHGIPFDLLLYVKHLRHVPTLARELPNLQMVINHLAKPRIKEQSLEDWLPGFSAAAACDNVWCKLSGMITEANWQAWQPSDLTPYVNHALELFGPKRLMFGSDWPVCELAGSYSRVVAALDSNLAALSAVEQDAIFRRSATVFYGLPTTTS